jgi:hypothetical protein
MQRQQYKSRSLGVTILAIFSFMLVGWNSLRLGEAIFFWKSLEEYGANPLYISVSGGLWLITGFIVFLGLWLGKRWGWMATIIVTAAYTSWYWLDRLFLQERHSNWCFTLITNIILLAIIYFILFLRNTKRYFIRAMYER